MPITSEKTFQFHPRKFFINDELDEYVIFAIEESVAQYINDKQEMSRNEFESVYEGFDPFALLDFTAWMNAGQYSTYAIELQNALSEMPNN